MAQLYFRYGSMNSSKTANLLMVAHNYEEQGKKALLFTPSVDDRYGVGVIGTRIGIKKKATVIEKDTDLFEITKKEKPNCVLIDEVQFIKKEHVLQLVKIVDELGIPVIGYGLKNDYRNELFEGSKYMLIYADKIEEIKTVCYFCDRKATMILITENNKPVYEGEQIRIQHFDDTEVAFYPVCRKCYHNPPNL